MVFIFIEPTKISQKLRSKLIDVFGCADEIKLIQKENKKLQYILDINRVIMALMKTEMKRKKMKYDETELKS